MIMKETRKGWKVNQPTGARCRAMIPRAPHRRRKDTVPGTLKDGAESGGTPLREACVLLSGAGTPPLGGVLLPAVPRECV